jgi:hypothetical protein
LVLGNRNTTSHEEALKRITSLPPIRQGKVLDIRRRIAAGTYEVGDRLDRAIDRLLEVLTGPPQESCPDGHGASRPVKLVVG